MLRTLVSRHNFAALLLARFFSISGNSLIQFSIPIVIYKMTGSAVYSGIAFALVWTEALLLPFMGSIADRFRLQSQLFVIEGIRLCLLPFMLLSATLPVFLLAAFLFSATANHAYILAESGYSRLLGNSRTGRIQARIQAVEDAALVVGPLLGGLLVMQWNIAGVAFISAICFAFTGGCMAILPLPPLPKTTNIDSARRNFWDLGAGFRIIRASPLICQLVALTMVVNLIEGVIIALMPVLLLSNFGQSVWNIGVLQSVAQGASALILISLSLFLKGKSLTGLAIVSGIIMAICVIVLGTSTSRLLFSVAFVAFFIAETTYIIYVRTERLHNISVHHMARAVAIMNFFVSLPFMVSGGIVAALGGWLSAQTIILITLGLSGLLSIAILLLFHLDRSRWFSVRGETPRLSE